MITQYNSIECDSLVVKVDDIQRIDAVFSDKIESIDEYPECGHISADEMLCELLTILGCVKTVESFNEVKKWYA